MSDHLMSNYKPLPVSFVRGEGPWLWDQQQQCYLDALGGIAVCALGHAHPAVTAALRDQAGKLLHTSNLYNIELQQTLADKLSDISGLERAFFCNSGAEANEAAIKIARRYAHQQGISEPKIIVMEGAFHGRTLATLTATANPKAKEGFAPLVAGFLRAPFNNVEAIETLAKQHDGICAILVEPIQGEGGVHVPDPGYLKQLRSLCDQAGWLLMLDEVQTGTGRTGRWFAYQHEAILPDVLTIAKALGNGVPIGACLARGEAATVLQPGSHGTTFGGNPLAMRAALAVLDTIEKESLLERCAALGERFLEGLQRSLGDVAGVTQIRGRGLMIGIELDRPCADIVAKAANARLLISVTGGNVIRLLPPYIIDSDQATAIIEGVSELVISFLEETTD